MRRLLCTVVVIVAGTTIFQPVHAADAGTQQQTVKQQLVAASTQISQLDLQMTALQQRVVDTQQRVDSERSQVRLLARVLYTQPDSLVAMVFESSSVSDAMTRIADLTSAGDRAASAKRTLEHDMGSLDRERTQLQSDRDRQVQLRKQLEVEFGKLAATLSGMSPAPPQPPIALGNASAIQQIILDAFAPLGGAGQTWAMRVARCESNYNPYAVNRYSGASGLFQFLPSTWQSMPQHSQSVFDPVANAQAAAVLYQRSGPNQWSCK